MLIKALHIEPSKPARVIEIRDDVGAEVIIGSDIKYMLPYDDKMLLAIDGAGKICGRPVNWVLRNKNGEVFDIIAGDFLIMAKEGNKTVSMSTAQIEACEKMLMQRETINDIPPEVVFEHYGQYVDDEAAGYFADVTGPERDLLAKKIIGNIQEKWKNIPCHCH